MKVQVEHISRWEVKEGISKTGKPWKAQSISLKIGEEWHNGFIFEMDWPKVKEGEMDILLYEDEYNGKKKKAWRFPPYNPDQTTPKDDRPDQVANPYSADDLPF